MKLIGPTGGYTVFMITRSIGKNKVRHRKAGHSHILSLRARKAEFLQNILRNSLSYRLLE